MTTGPTLPRRDQTYRNFLVDSTRWDRFKFRSGDIVISTPPKSGTTWTQMICALLIFRTPKLEQRLADFSPWLDLALAPIEDVIAGYECQTHRRFIKTHTPLDGIPYLEDVTYLCVARDPRDAFLSMDNHLRNTRPEFAERMRATRAEIEDDSSKPQSGPDPTQYDHAPTVKEYRRQFRDWIAVDGRPWSSNALNGAPTVLYHVKSFWPFRHLPNIHLFHYSDLLRDLDGRMREMANALDIDIPEVLWPDLVAAARFENMKRNSESLVPEADKDMWNDPQQFFHKGTSGQWRDLLGEEELELYRKAMRERLDPDLAKWLENGSDR